MKISKILTAAGLTVAIGGFAPSVFAQAGGGAGGVAGGGAAGCAGSCRQRCEYDPPSTIRGSTRNPGASKRSP